MDLVTAEVAHNKLIKIDKSRTMLRLTFKTEVFEFVAFRVSDVAGSFAKVLGRQLQIRLPGWHGGTPVLGGHLFEGSTAANIVKGHV